MNQRQIFPYLLHQHPYIRYSFRLMPPLLNSSSLLLLPLSFWHP
jgi:hypothetical protein